MGCCGSKEAAKGKEVAYYDADSPEDNEAIATKAAFRKQSGRGLTRSSSVKGLLSPYAPDDGEEDGDGDGAAPAAARKYSTNAFNLNSLPDRHDIDHGSVEMVPFQDSWAAVFEEDAAELKSVLGDVLVDAHHVGSTAIQGLVAKNIVDVLIVVKSLEQFDKKRGVLQDAEYVWCGEPVPGGRYLYNMRKTAADEDPHVRTHVHVTPTPLTKNSKAVLTFRDALRRDEKLRARYAEMKEGLADAHKDDRKAYNAQKTLFIKATIKDEEERLQGMTALAEDAAEDAAEDPATADAAKVTAQHQKRAKKLLTKKLGREPTDEEVAKKAKALAKKAAAKAAAEE